MNRTEVISRGLGDMKAAVIAMFLSEGARAHLLDEIVSQDPSRRYPALREFYKRCGKEIRSVGRAQWGIDPYEVDWLAVFTPIEYALWQDIRQAGAVFYPQYPVGRFFVDFANPVAMVAIECDGAAFHRDAQKDAARDAILRSSGWAVYRITGRDCKTDFDESLMQAGRARKFIDQIVATHGVSAWSV